MKRQAIEWDKILANHIYNKGLISRIFKRLLKLNNNNKKDQTSLFLRAKWSESESRSVVSNSLWPHGLYSLWNSPSQNTGVGSLSLLQGIFPTQGSNPGISHCRWILYQLSHKGSPRIPKWVAYPFSSRSSQPRNQTGASCIAGRFFTNCVMREALIKGKGLK